MSTVTYTATITLTGGGINIVPGQTQSGEPASMLVGSFLKGDQGDRGYEGLGIFRTPEAATVQTTSLTKATVIVPQGRTIQAGSLVLSGSLCFQVSAVGDAVLTVTYVCDFRGLQGVPGDPGEPGTPGVSPAVTISKAGGVTTITITDSSGLHVATINDGSDATVTKAAVEAVLTGLISTHSHTVTKSDVGLGNVPNTNFTARIEALEGKTDLADFAEDATHRTVTDVEKTKLAGLSNYDDTEVRGDISSIEDVIPDTATVSNKLADQAFVNSSIATNAATFRGNVTAADDTETAAQTALATIAIKDNNDYANVVVPGTPNAGLDKYKRYTFNGTVWSFNYAINTSGFTAAQWAAINSGATAEVIAAIAGKYVKPSGGIPSSDMTAEVRSSLSKADSALQGVPSTYRTASAQDVIDSSKVSVNQQSFTDVQKSQARSNIGAIALTDVPVDIYTAVYDVEDPTQSTAYADVVAAHTAGKRMQVRAGCDYYPLRSIEYGEYCFVGIDAEGVNRLYVCKTSGWETSEMEFLTEQSLDDYRPTSEQDDIDGEQQLQLDEIFDDANTNDYEELPKLCGQPMILFGAGTPQEAIVPVNWKQFANGGYNWNGLPSAMGQVYINMSVSSNGRYTGCPKADGTLEWKNF